MALADMSAMTDAMQDELATFVIAYAGAPQDHDMATFASGFAAAHNMNLTPLKHILQDTLAILSTAITGQASSADLVAALLAAGVNEATAKRFGVRWTATSHASGRSLQLVHSELIDMTWKLGITTATNLLPSVGAPFVVLTFVLQPRGTSLRSTETLELSLPMFYQFLANVEALQAHLSFLQT
ncbi:hypothetical protein SPRG_04255 [Saprolegnia parasitica CBS 223.65]|uniref:COMM domain-containing protein n=1 Tax=Saprolegnia parasitica (strain CBS 223.65) TaxID=695850 RepID=A0A067CX68_SAPPC|nr:hypothetical protein SPRG_04255 [Saprolegnia parasitica CBS 223.65]KDO31116.1 hypothetical protein SPRG_04255 [Saprolegnia parasitica CBS 223.65]|eukprot:XP_012198245.1 hypothetical protein SPRG_04255 [Saprolegnia parasitica CBS 223.65]